MIPRQIKYIIHYYFRKEPKDFFEFVNCIEKIDNVAFSDRSKRKIANSLLIYAKHSLKPEEYEFVKKKLCKKYNIKPRLL